MAAQNPKTPALLKAAWQRLAGALASESGERARVNERVTTFADFDGGFAGWQRAGQGLRQGPVKNGDFVIALQGKGVLRTILPNGVFTHAVSDRLNGTVRSPILPADKKYISFCVLGQQQSAVRLVSNGCQLNYRNYRALTDDKLHWITFPIPEDCASLRVYGELSVRNPAYLAQFDEPEREASAERAS